MKFRDDIQESTGSKNFLKLKDKESITGIFRGDIEELYVVWENGKSRQVEEGEAGAKFRFRVNFVVKEGPTYVPRIFEQGLIVYRQLSELHSEYDLETTVVKITRNGTGTDTTYSILPLLKKPPTPETLKILDALELLPLSSDKSSSDSASDNSEEIPF